jgi:hypothetical protein
VDKERRRHGKGRRAHLPKVDRDVSRRPSRNPRRDRISSAANSVGGLGRIDVDAMNVAALRVVAIEGHTARARHQRARHLGRHPLASFPHRIFPLDPIPPIAPGLIICLCAFCRKYSPRGFKVGACLVEGGGRAVKIFAWRRARVEAADPAPRVLMMRDAGADSDRADADVSVIDVPAVLAFGIAAAGELGHGP